MPTWWIWRLSPHPQKQLAEVELPWSYLAADPLTQNVFGLRGLETLVGRAEREQWPDVVRRHGIVEPRTRGTTLPRAGDTLEQGLLLLEEKLQQLRESTHGRMTEHPIGSMRTLLTEAMIRSPGRGKAHARRLLLTPPFYLFANLNIQFPKTDIHWPYFMIQPEVFSSVGEIMESTSANKIWLHGKYGSTANPLHVSDVPSDEPGAFVMTALDSFLERGRPDPRFL